MRLRFHCTGLNPYFIPESVLEIFKVVLTFEPVDKILWCHHSNEASSALLSRIQVFYKIKFGICL